MHTFQNVHFEDCLLCNNALILSIVRIEMFQACWSKQPDKRPTFKKLANQFAEINNELSKVTPADAIPIWGDYGDY